MTTLLDSLAAMPQLFWVAFAALLGLLVGSHLNVVVYRVPAGRSTLRPRSACPACGRQVRWFDNVPVLSWLVLRARCRDCTAPISARYPLVEVGTAALFALVAWLFAPGRPTLVTAAVLTLATAGVALSLIDVDTHRLPDAVLAPAAALSVTLLVGASWQAGQWGGLERAAAGGAGLAFFYFVAAVVRPGGMGMGDVKLSALLGFACAWLGWGPFAVASFVPFLLGAVFVAVKAAVCGVRRGDGVPFGPFMCAGALVGLLAGASVSDWYLSLFALA